MANKHFMYVEEPAGEADPSVRRVACRVHPDQALVVKERVSADGRKATFVMVQCPACLRSAHSHEERERCTLVFSQVA